MDLCNRFQSIFRAMTHGLYMIVDGMAALKPDLKAPAHCAKLAARRFKYCEPEVITKPTSTSEILQYVLIGALLAFAIIFLIELLAARFLYEYVNNGKGANFRRVRRNRAQKQSHKRTASATRQELDDSDEQLYAEALSPNLQLVTESQVFGSRQLSEEQKSHQFMLERPGLFVRGIAFYLSFVTGMMTWDGKVIGHYPFHAQYKALKDHAACVLSRVKAIGHPGRGYVWMKAIGHQGCRYVRMKMQTMISFIVDNSRLGEEYIRGKLQMAKEALMEKTRGGSRAREDNRGSFGDSGKEGGTGKVPLKADGFPKSPDRPEYTTPRLRRPWS